MICKESLRLIPGYLDGELSEAQSAPLRQHLIDCPTCRKAASGEKAFKRWFEPEAPAVEVPVGFAARVVRRAFAGETGEAPVAEQEAPILRFALRATAAAAVLLLVLSAWVRSVQLAQGNIEAETRVRTEVIRRDMMERRERLMKAAASRDAQAKPGEEENGSETPAEGDER